MGVYEYDGNQYSVEPAVILQSEYSSQHKVSMQQQGPHKIKPLNVTGNLLSEKEADMDSDR